jgi:hypothetical protein
MSTLALPTAILGVSQLATNHRVTPIAVLEQPPTATPSYWWRGLMVPAVIIEFRINESGDSTSVSRTLYDARQSTAD